jgi:putative PIN family toxin of toxin-antitoxin system
MQENSFVLDANIWISIFLKKEFALIDRIVFDEKINIYRSAELTKELENVLSRKKFVKYFDFAAIEEYLSFYKDYTKYFEIERIFTDCSDAKDNYLFDLAYQTQSKYLVSGDKIVLATKVKPSLKLITLTEFKQMFFI